MLTLHVKTPGSLRRCSIDVAPNIQLSDLKRRVADVTGLPSDDRLCLVVRGTALCGGIIISSSSSSSARAADGDVGMSRVVDGGVTSAPAAASREISDGDGLRQQRVLGEAPAAAAAASAPLPLRDHDTLLASARPRPPPPHVTTAVGRGGRGEEEEEAEEEERFDLPPSASPLQQRLFQIAREKLKVPAYLILPLFWLSPRTWLLVLLWFVSAPLLQIYFELGPVWVLGTCFALIFCNLGTRQQGEASAYSIFNEGFQELPGTLNAQRLDEDIRAGRL